MSADIRLSSDRAGTVPIGGVRLEAATQNAVSRQSRAGGRGNVGASASRSLRGATARLSNSPQRGVRERLRSSTGGDRARLRRAAAELPRARRARESARAHVDRAGASARRAGRDSARAVGGDVRGHAGGDQGWRRVRSDGREPARGTSALHVRGRGHVAAAHHVKSPFRVLRRLPSRRPRETCSPARERCRSSGRPWRRRTTRAAT